ncbi:hypothetical protein ElyMa_002539000 [Elysia marginata]|uniref:Uncharacterized protein n=1 Tax=Elysia marginata TaxID=1093978 RepID=A0AAV4GVR0_9GAST|nr:hypothetical protein ElyMa_002539000 [Elysia marginata]
MNCDLDFLDEFMLQDLERLIELPPLQLPLQLPQQQQQAAPVQQLPLQERRRRQQQQVDDDTKHVVKDATKQQQHSTRKGSKKRKVTDENAQPSRPRTQKRLELDVFREKIQNPGACVNHLAVLFDKAPSYMFEETESEFVRVHRCYNNNLIDDVTALRLLKKLLQTIAKQGLFIAPDALTKTQFRYISSLINTKFRSTCSVREYDDTQDINDNLGCVACHEKVADMMCTSCYLITKCSSCAAPDNTCTGCGLANQMLPLMFRAPRSEQELKTGKKVTYNIMCRILSKYIKDNNISSWMALIAQPTTNIQVNGLMKTLERYFKKGERFSDIMTDFKGDLTQEQERLFTAFVNLKRSHFMASCIPNLTNGWTEYVICSKCTSRMCDAVTIKGNKLVLTTCSNCTPENERLFRFGDGNAKIFPRFAGVSYMESSFFSTL